MQSPSYKPSANETNFFQTFIKCCHISGLTSEEGGCSGLTRNQQDGSICWLDQTGKKRSVSHIQDVHLKEEIFFVGNLLSAVVCCIYLTRGLFGLLAGVLSLSYAWKKAPTLKKWTNDLKSVPSYALKVLPLVGNAYAAKLNKQAVEKSIASIQGPTPPLQPPSTESASSKPDVLKSEPGIKPTETTEKPISDPIAPLQEVTPQTNAQSDTVLQETLQSLSIELAKALTAFNAILDFGPKRDKCSEGVKKIFNNFIYILPHTELLRLEADRLARLPITISFIDPSIHIPEDLIRPLIAAEVVRRATPSTYLEELLQYSTEQLNTLQKTGHKDIYGRVFDQETVKLAMILQSQKPMPQDYASTKPLQQQINDHNLAKKFLHDHLQSFESTISFFSPPPKKMGSSTHSKLLDPTVFSFERTMGVQHDIQMGGTSTDDSIIEVYGVASQANLSENTIPEPVQIGRGVEIYASDRTQGPMAQLCFSQAQVELLVAAGNLGFNSLVNVLDENSKTVVQHGYCQPLSNDDCSKICAQIQAKGDKIEYACVTSKPKGGQRPIHLLFGFAPCFVDTTTAQMRNLSQENRFNLSYQVALQNFRAQLAHVLQLAKSNPSKKIVFKPSGLGLGAFANDPNGIGDAYLEACQEFSSELQACKAEVRWQIHCSVKQTSSEKYDYPIDTGALTYLIAKRLNLRERPRSLDSLAQQIGRTMHNKTNIVVENLSKSINWTTDQVKEIIQNSTKVAAKISSDCASLFRVAFFAISSGIKEVQGLCRNGVLGSALKDQIFTPTLPVILPIPPSFGTTFSLDILRACHDRAKVFLQNSLRALGAELNFYSPPPLAPGSSLPKYEKDFASQEHNTLDSSIFACSQITGIQDAIQADANAPRDEVIAYGLDNQWNGIPSPYKRPVPIGESATIYTSPKTTQGAQALSSLPPEQTEVLNLGAHLGFNSLTPILDNNTKTSVSYGYFTPNTLDKFNSILKKFQSGGEGIEYLSMHSPTTDQTKKVRLLFSGLPAWGEYVLDSRISQDQERELSYYVALAGFRAQFAQILNLAKTAKKPALFKLSEMNLECLGNSPEAILQAYYEACREFSPSFTKNQVKIEWLFTKETLLTAGIKKLIKTSDPVTTEPALSSPSPPSISLPPTPPPSVVIPEPTILPITKQTLISALTNCSKKFSKSFPKSTIQNFIDQSIPLDGSKKLSDILPIPNDFTKQATIEQQRACHEKAKTFLRQFLPVVDSTPHFVSAPKTPIPEYQNNWKLPPGSDKALDESTFSWENTNGVWGDITNDADRSEETLVLYGAASQFNGAEATRPVTLPPGQAVTNYRIDRTQGPQAQLAFSTAQVELINIGANLGWNGLCHVLDDSTKSLLVHGYLSPTNNQSCETLIQQCKERGHLAEFPCIEGFPQGPEKKSVHLMLVAAPAFGGYLTGTVSPEKQAELAYHVATICWRAQFQQALQLAKQSGKPVIFKAAGVGLGVFDNNPMAVAQAYYNVCQEFTNTFRENRVSVRWQLFEGNLHTPSGSVVSALNLKNPDNPSRLSSLFSWLGTS